MHSLKFDFLMSIIRNLNFLPSRWSSCHFPQFHLLHQCEFWFMNLSCSMVSLLFLYFYLWSRFEKQEVQLSFHHHIDLNETFNFFVLVFWLNFLVLGFGECLMVFLQSWIWLLIFHFFFYFEMKSVVPHADWISNGEIFYHFSFFGLTSDCWLLVMFIWFRVC